MSSISETAEVRTGLPRPVLTIRGRIVGLACLIAASTALLVGGISYLRVAEITLEREVAKLRGDARLIAPRFRAAFDQLAQDALIISRTPPFQGLARSIPNDGLDPKDGSTTELWRQRLQTIFASIMEHRPGYVQMRYIGVGDGGRELVRVDRRNGRIHVVDKTRLQRKAGEAYFQAGSGVPNNAVYFSEVTLNREEGRIQKPHLPVIRVVSPIYGQQGLFGLLVINADYRKFLGDVLLDLDADGEIHVLNDSGDYITRYAGGGLSPLVLRGALESDVPAAIRVLDSATSVEETLFTAIGDTDVAVHRSSLDIGEDEGGRLLAFALARPMAELLVGAHAARRASLWSGAGLIVLATLLALIVTGMMTQPMQQVVEAMRAYAGYGARKTLPLSRPDEIGELARAFDALTRQLDESREAQQEAAERFRTLRKNAADALIRYDADGKIMDFNLSAERMFRYDEGEAIGRNISTLIAEPDEVDQLATPLLANINTDDRFRIALGRRKGGGTFPAEMRTTRIEFGKESFNNVIVRDVTRRLRGRQEIAERTAELERSNRDLDEFAYIASHDLKEPLRGISNHVQFLAEDYEEVLGQDGRKRIARLRELCARADKLTSELLYYSRLGRAQYDADSFDFDTMMEDIRVSLADTLAERNAEMRIVGELPSVICDRARIESAFRNLVVNGVKYNESPERLIEIGYEPTATSPDGRTVGAYYVRDNGIGIPVDQHEEIFKIFRRLNSEKKFGAGTGAGLSFVKKIVARHGGLIWLDSEPGRGTTFYIHLPGAQS